MTTRPLLSWLYFCLLAGGSFAHADTDAIPLPEHPRPDFQRALWTNLNGPWQFRFDGENRGLTEKWFNVGQAFPETIIVPFPWGSALSKVQDKAAIAWYHRSLQIPESWQDR